MGTDKQNCSFNTHKGMKLHPEDRELEKSQ